MAVSRTELAEPLGDNVEHLMADLGLVSRRFPVW